MANIVKLTVAFGRNAGKLCYINLDNILAMYIDTIYNCTVIETTNELKSFTITETPEEIMQLAKKGNG